jgi:Ca-activated chloride channel family protein
MNWEHNPYTILGVASDASTEEIKSAYRKIARRLHPDVNPDNPAAMIQFQHVTTAYELLIDPDHRKSYDEKTRKADTSGDLYFSLRVTPSKRGLMPLPEPQVIYLLAEIYSDPTVQESEKRQDSKLNLTLVLDYSNSMAGTRIEKVKIAAQQIIDNLKKDDILSIVIFNDRAETIIPATTVNDRPALKARVSMIIPSGGTEIFHGLSKGLEENRKYLGPRMVNHIILLTDGHTFGDQDKCLALADTAREEGISISGMGLGNDWNDEFLDNLASKTGGHSAYISSANVVVQFLNDQVRNLTDAFAERIQLSIAADPDIQLESAFKLSPHAQPLTIEGGALPLGSLHSKRPISVLLQLQIPSDLAIGYRYIARIAAMGDILANKTQNYLAISDVALEVTDDTPLDDPPTAILDALSKLTLYRLQERAQEALESGDVNEATRRLENLATRLLAMGEEELANQALSEARRVAHTADLSDKGRKALKYQTRYLLASPINEDKDQ